MTEQGTVKRVSDDLCRSELSPRESAAWDGFLRAHAAMFRIGDSRVQREHGITIKESEVLLMLAREEHLQMRMSDLAVAIDLSASGTTRLVERLERRGLVSRKPCPSDRRGHLALLTESGRELASKARSSLAGAVREHFLNHFSDDDLDRMISFWERLLEGAGQEISDFGGSALPVAQVRPD